MNLFLIARIWNISCLVLLRQFSRLLALDIVLYAMRLCSGRRNYDDNDDDDNTTELLILHVGDARSGRLIVRI